MTSKGAKRPGPRSSSTGGRGGKGVLPERAAVSNPAITEKNHMSGATWYLHCQVGPDSWIQNCFHAFPPAPKCKVLTEAGWAPAQFLPDWTPQRSMSSDEHSQPQNFMAT